MSDAPEFGPIPLTLHPYDRIAHRRRDEAWLADAWDRSYSREKAAFPAPYVRERKFWPAVSTYLKKLSEAPGLNPITKLP